MAVLCSVLRRRLVGHGEVMTLHSARKAVVSDDRRSTASAQAAVQMRLPNTSA